ncbi:type I-B CRISPR-associated protein Cas5b [Anaerocolumna xylanovorans]|uniref:CRISPR-associated protein Cas5h n=1 Tax=Anaerocolumna xylanovorans DSM 12503 TaxID=1121345 RepID=A0A1M7YD78_9FIRM|nr:type I-B CRISPR-associated protein Cas5b [Anaerocolumna xylanovorans]SHO50563.1 CRISPR-associated protein Cas5h [Anaerocolumna xylanovorans DSM 12503]
MKCICFKLKGDYGHFKPYYTTSSPTTYSLMPPTALYGLIGAVLGFPKEDNLYYSKLEEAGLKVGIGLLTPLRKTSMSTNLVNTKGNFWVPTGRNTNGVRTPTRYEYVVGQEYLIFVSMTDEILLEKLADRLKEHRFAYSISMGLAGLLAEVELIAYEEAYQLNQKDYIELDTAVSIEELTGENSIGINGEIQYCRERYVKRFSDNRIPAEYVDALFATNGKKIKVKCKKAYSMKEYTFAFLNDD